MKSAVLDTLDDLDVGIDQLLPTPTEETKPEAHRVWPICTESQWLNRTFGWEKIKHCSTSDFPDNYATVRPARNTGKPDMVYGVYFNYDSHKHTTPHGYQYNTRGRLVITAYGQPGARHFSFNGACFAGGDLRGIHDTIEMIESKIQAASNG
jgi:hypothetical protein